MKHATSRLLFAYWDGLRGERAAPDRAEIEPGAIRQILADTFILELGEDRSPSFRLAGTRLCALFGAELRGRSFAGLWGAAAGEAEDLVATVLDETAGVVAGLAAADAEGRGLALEMVLLPLRHRGKTQARMLGALAALALPPWVGLRPLGPLAVTSTRVIRASPRLRSAVPEADLVALERRRAFVVHRGGLA
ncbi:MAG TPA: PAS domain-containing protein [Beijerinckiaceae bacterium]|nr:PAS domain-containing protein [Beijerinckiaceae bacterium]